MASDLAWNDGSSGLLSQRGPVKSFNGTNAFKIKGLTMRLAATQFNFNNPMKTSSPFKSPKSISQPGTPCRGLDSPSKAFSLEKRAVRYEKKKDVFMSRIRDNRKLAKNIFKSSVESEYPEPEVLAHDYDESIYDNMFIDLPLINLSAKDEDEGFISEPESISIDGEDVFRYPEEDLDDLYPPSPSLPSLSDIED